MLKKSCQILIIYLPHDLSHLTPFTPTPLYSVYVCHHYYSLFRTLPSCLFSFSLSYASVCLSLSLFLYYKLHINYYITDKLDQSLSLCLSLSVNLSLCLSKIQVYSFTFSSLPLSLSKQSKQHKHNILHLGSSLTSSISYTFAFLGVKTFVDLNELLGTVLVTFKRLLDRFQLDKVERFDIAYMQIKQ